MNDVHLNSAKEPGRGFSRRDLFRTVGLATGGAMLLGLPKFLGGWVGQAEAAQAARPFGPSMVMLELEGQPAGLVTSIEGGNAFADIIPGAVGPDGVQRKHRGNLHFEDLIIGVALSNDSKSLAGWITDSLMKAPQPKHGAIVYADFTMNEVKRLEFSGALLSEITVPSANAADKTSASLTLRLTPQSTSLTGSSGKKVQTPLGAKQKNVLAGNFRFNVQGLEQACVRITKVDPIVTRRKVGQDKIGALKESQPLLGPWDCAPVSLFLPEADAGPFYAWFHDSVLEGKPGDTRSGLLEWLDPTLKSTLSSVQLGGLGIVRYAPNPVKVGVEAIAMVQIDMYCETVNMIL